MKQSKIYIICTASAGGRYLNGAATEQDKARAEAARAVVNFTCDGWRLTETKAIRQEPDAAAAGEPAVVEVHHLRNKAGDWCNVELYSVTEKDYNNDNK